MNLRSEERPSWYLDPLVAAQKRKVHLAWIRGAAKSPGTILKTDLFEEAYGEDRILDELAGEATVAIGIDWTPRTVRSATRRAAGAFQGLVCDVRRLPFPAGSMDLVVSTSTLDHFE